MQCTNCNGTGVRGAGGASIEHVGQLVTDPKCNGTGQEPEVMADVVPEVVDAPEVPEVTPEEAAKVEEEATAQPPVDNEHVAEGATQFDQATIDANAPVQEGEGKGILGRVVDAILG